MIKSNKILCEARDSGATSKVCCGGLLWHEMLTHKTCGEESRLKLENVRVSDSFQTWSKFVGTLDGAQHDCTHCIVRCYFVPRSTSPKFTFQVAPPSLPSPSPSPSLSPYPVLAFEWATSLAVPKHNEWGRGRWWVWKRPINFDQDCAFHGSEQRPTWWQCCTPYLIGNGFQRHMTSDDMVDWPIPTPAVITWCTRALSCTECATARVSSRKGGRLLLLVLSTADFYFYWSCPPLISTFTGLVHRWFLLLLVLSTADFCFYWSCPPLISVRTVKFTYTVPFYCSNAKSFVSWSNGISTRTRTKRLGPSRKMTSRAVRELGQRTSPTYDG